MENRAQKLWERGIGHFRQGNLQAAQANFEAFLAREPASAGPANFRLSMIQARRGRFRAAIELGRAALASAPDQLEMLTHLARCHLMDGEPEEARRLATRALAQPDKSPVALDSLAVIMTRLDEPVLAIELFNQAIGLDPGQASMLFNRGLAQRQFGFIDAAEADLEACVAIRPLHAKAHWNLSALKPWSSGDNHVERLSRCLRGVHGAADEELLSLALFKELDDLGNTTDAAASLARGISSRRGRAPPPSPPAHVVDMLAGQCGPAFVAGRDASPGTPAPVFIVGMPRSGVGLLGSLLARHPRAYHLGAQQPFSRLLWRSIGRDPEPEPSDATIAEWAGLDFESLAVEYLAAVTPPSGSHLLVFESQPMNFRLVGFIARAFPRSRILHMVRDPVDTCMSILGHAGGESSLPSHRPDALGGSYLEYQRLMRHWHGVVPDQIMDVSYESLVRRPEMVLRVMCAFLRIRYASGLRTGLRLHARSIGRGHRYVEAYPALSRILAHANPGDAS